jgi:predicted ribosomally synthesized peptide with SipW-like signal peptide
MTKRILKSILILSLLLTTVATATKAWFTSNVTAADNQIQTGTLRAALGTTADINGAGTGYVVAYDNNGAMTNVAQFPVITAIQPSVSGDTANEKDIYVAVYNTGTLAFNYQSLILGNWATGGDAGLMQVRRIHRYATNDWEGEWGAANLKTWLDANGYAWQSAVSAGTAANVTGIFNDGQMVDAKSYQIYKVSVGLNSEATNSYQGEIYQYAMYLQTKQVNAPTF